MTDFTPSEIETILRDQWDGAESFGGFASEAMREYARNGLRKEFGEDCLDGFTLIGETSWNTYEEGESQILMIDPTGQLVTFRSGVSVYGSYGESIKDEAYFITIEEWLTVVTNNEATETPYL